MFVVVNWPALLLYVAGGPVRSCYIDISDSLSFVIAFILDWRFRAINLYLCLREVFLSSFWIACVGACLARFHSGLRTLTPG